MKSTTPSKLTCGICGQTIPLKEVPLICVTERGPIIHHRECNPIPQKPSDIKRLVLAKVAESFGVSVDLIMSENRSWRVSEARHCLCHALAVRDVPTVEIAKFIGRDRSTTRHGVRMHHKLAETCAKYREKAGRVTL